ncbi:MAG: DUF1194 domain-containing protein [Methylibium sp.]|uniref:DUF1194 domain-containing protein n=1 Tax=Methylibium sp. TaxID=2067992 RepID=UPI0018215C3B|nr:DUF1194 domain-containing protein [Methylibium sp.]MBA3599256.1 DUF1194 domain-containing protein [Methylibium sp.]
MRKPVSFKPLALAIALGLGSTSALAVTVVDLELALLVDSSNSISATEFALQRDGYAAAFNNPTLQAAFDAGRSVAATLVYWSGASEQSVAVGWTLIDSAASAGSFADMIGATVRPFSGLTAIANAISYAVPLFASNDFDAARQVIDVSGDGISSTFATQIARNAALGKGGIDQINGLAIGSQTIRDFYQNNVIGGTGSFVVSAATFNDFSGAISEKLGREIVIGQPIPEPETYALMLAGLGLIGFMARRKGRG